MSVDDTNLHRPSTSEQAKRSHRRSVGSFDAGNNASAAEDFERYTLYQSKLGLTSEPHASWQDQKGMLGDPVTPLPPSSHSRNGSADSVTSGILNPSPPSVSTDYPLLACVYQLWSDDLVDDLTNMPFLGQTRGQCKSCNTHRLSPSQHPDLEE